MSQTETITLAAVGDISLGDHPACVSLGVRSRFEELASDSIAYPFGALNGRFREYDLAFGNLETVLSDSGLLRGDVRSRQMRGDPAVVSRLAAAGFNVLNVANNHILQHGVDPFRETVEAVRASGIDVVGVAAPGGASAEPVLVTIRGVTVAFLGYAFEPDRYFSERPLYAFGPACNIPAEIGRARDSADVVVCSMHWGDEFMRRPPAANIALARRVIDAGAHLVLGHHPHVYQGIERYRHGFIAYSLGNFVFDMLWHRWLRYGLLLSIRLSRAGIEELRPEFVYIGSDYQPRVVQHPLSLLADLENISGLIHEPFAEERYTSEYRRLVRRNRMQCYLHVFRHSRCYEAAMLRQIVQQPFLARLTRPSNPSHAVDRAR